MRLILAYLLYALMWLITLPPLALCQAFGRLIAWVLRVILRYRQTIIRTNLSKSFPGRSGEDLLAFEKSYYRWLGQLIIESLYVIHLNSTKLSKRVKLVNPELLAQFAAQNQDLIIMAAHTGNWEWTPGAVCPYGYDLLGVYKPQSNKVIDQLTKLLRSKPDVIPIPMKGTLRALLDQKSREKPRALLLLADQTPAQNDINHWAYFLNQPTGWFDGAEKLSQRFSLPVLYLKMSVVKPGYYHAELIPLNEKGQIQKKGELLDYYIYALEQCIIENPPYWLWSHRRWKHQPEGVTLSE